MSARRSSSRPLPRPVRRGLSPLERAGWCTRGVPVADFVRRFTTTWDEDGPDVFAAPAAQATYGTKGRRHRQPVLAPWSVGAKS